MMRRKDSTSFLFTYDIYCGPTQSEKSMFTKRLIENSSAIFTEVPEKFLYAYYEYQNFFDDMQNIPN